MQSLVEIACNLLLVTQKKSAWKVFGTHYESLCDLGKADLTSEVIQTAEKFIRLLYNLNDMDKCDKAWVVMFCKGRSQESLPQHLMQPYCI